MKLSLVVPCYNEEGNVRRFFDTVNTVFCGKLEDYEFVFVDDGSRDSTRKILKELYFSDENTGKIQLVSFSRNFGKEAAIYAGLSKAKGELICVIDADLQQRPEVVLEMLDKMNGDGDIDCVAAYQQERKEGKGVSFAKSAFYGIINRLADVPFVNGASDFRLMKKSVADAVLQMKEYHRFSKGMFSYVGFNTEYIPYTVCERESGESKWSTGKLIKYAFEGIFAFSTKLLKLPKILGLLFILLSLGDFIFLAVQRLVLSEALLSLVIILGHIFLVGGSVLLSLGIMGEYLAKMYEQGKDRPVYIVKEYLDNDKNGN